MGGNVKYIDPQSGFKKVGKSIIFNKEVDVLTLGIYIKAISMGPNWEMNVKGLASVLGISLDRVRKAFATLEKAGYLRRSRAQDDEGRLNGWNYEFSPAPFTDIAKTPTSVLCDDVIKPMSGNDLNKGKEVKPIIEDNNIGKEIETIYKTPASFPFPQPFLLSSKERDLAGNDPTKIVKIKRLHIQKNLEVIERDVAMDSNQSRSFLDYWCSSDNYHPEKIRAESDRCFNLRQRAENWMKREMDRGRIISTSQKSRIEQYADAEKKYNELIARMYGTNPNNTGAGDSSENTPDEQ